MTPADRRRLIEAPLTVRTFGGRGWSGASFAHIDMFRHRGRAQSVYYDAFDAPSTFTEGESDADSKPKR